MIVNLIAGLIKRHIMILLILRIKNESIFSKLIFEPFGGNINFKVDLSNYATKVISKTFLKLII